MNPRDDTRTDDDQRGFGVGRRKFLAAGAALTTTLVAGCTGGSSSKPMGSFRLYISDQPVAIDEFDSLEVMIDGGRVFRADDSSEDSETATTQTPTQTTTDGNVTATTANETATTVEETATTANETETTAEESASEQDGFVEIDVDNETVDLTEVTGEKAIGVFDGELPTGRYSSIHLSVSEVGGVVDGDAVDVELPSDRLKIVKPFEVSEDEPLEFVFDISVVKKGQSGGYNLLPVIGESGVVGEDVEMEEIERGQGSDAATNETTAAN